MKKIDELLASLDRKKMPCHIAIIMDGNGRWAKSKGLPRIMGHSKGVDAARQMVRFIGKKLPEVKVLTLYVFSTENWTRPSKEIQGLMLLLKRYLISEIPELNRNDVKLRWIGRKSGLSEGVLKSLNKAMRSLQGNTGLTLNLAINYGGRAEITDAVKDLARNAVNGKISPDRISGGDIENLLYAPELPSVDLLIRTGGDIRISNFMLWQIAYAELFFTPVEWPAFSPSHLVDSILDFQRKERRFGAIKNNLG